MTILIINGPNLNLLPKRDSMLYGTKTLDEIQEMLQNYARNKVRRKVDLKFFQSNHEGALIDYIQQEAGAFGLIINPGGLSHYSIALSDALRDFKGKKVEVHLSDISKRETFRKISITGAACDKVIAGKKEKGYMEALKFLIDPIASDPPMQLSE